MSTQITTAHVKSFADGITDLARQKGSRLRGGVRVESGITGDREFYDQIGATQMTQLTTRHGDTPLTDTPHSRHMVTLNPYVVADLIDEQDLVRVLNEPQGAYARSMADAAGHTIDDVIIAAATGSEATGVDGGTAVAFDTTNYQIAAGAAGLTLAKIIEARKILLEAENDPDMPWYLAHSAEQLEDVLNDSTITSADYATGRALQSGNVVGDFLGFQWVHTERLGLSGTDRRVLAWVRDDLLLGVGMEPRASIRVRADKNDSIQIRYAMDLGATRMSGTGVVDILCTE